MAWATTWIPCSPGIREPDSIGSVLRKRRPLPHAHRKLTYHPNHPRNDSVTLREAAQRLNVGLAVVRRMIAEKKLPASQVVACATWQIPAAALESEAVRREI